MGTFIQSTSREAAVCESKLTWTIAEAWGIHPLFTLLRLLSVSLNYLEQSLISLG